MKQSIWFVFGILHFICQKTADFAKNEMQKFGENMSDFKKARRKKKKR